MYRKKLFRCFLLIYLYGSGSFQRNGYYHGRIILLLPWFASLALIMVVSMVTFTKQDRISSLTVAVWKKMYLSSTRYVVMLTLQLSLMLVDLAINSFSNFFRRENIVVLVVYIIQDFCLVFSLISIFLNLFSTFIFQAGLVGLLLERFKTTIIICILYLILTISFHIWSLTVQWNLIPKPTWTNALVALFIAQRLTAAVYYYYYKHTILRISDPRYYEDFRWLRKEMEGIT